jgi:hypothetical protein
MPRDTVGPGYYALMRLDEFVASRVVEAVVHGLDLTDALGRRADVHPEGVAVHRDDPRRAAGPPHRRRRPEDLAGDDLAWVRAASAGARPTPIPGSP